MATVEYPNEPRTLPRTFWHILVFALVSFVSTAISLAILAVPLSLWIVLGDISTPEFYSTAWLGVGFVLFAGTISQMMDVFWGDSNLDEEVTKRDVAVVVLLLVASSTYAYAMLGLGLAMAALLPQYGLYAALFAPLADRVLIEKLGVGVGILVVLPFVLVLRASKLRQNASIDDLLLGGPRRPFWG